MKTIEDCVEAEEMSVEKRENKGAVGILSAGHFAADIYSGFISPIMPFIAAKLGISIAIAGFILSLSSITSSIFQPVFGYFADSIGRRFFILTGLILAAVFVSILGVIPNPWLFTIAIAVGNLGVGLFHPQATGLTAYFSGNNINKLMGIFTACGTIGYAAGSIISSALVQNFGLESTPFAMIPGLTAALFVYLFLPKIPKDSFQKDQPDFKLIFKEICTNKILVIMLMISIINSLTMLTFIVFMPFLWKDLNYSVAQIGFALSILSLFGGFSSFLGGLIANRIGRKKVFMISALSTPIVGLSALYLLNSHPWLSFVLFTAVGFFTMISTSLNTIISQASSPENRNMVSGIMGFGWGISGLSLTPVGFLVEHFGVVPVLSIVSMFSFLIMFLIRNIPNQFD